MSTITAYGWHQPFIADHIHAALAVKFAFAKAVLLITLLTYIIDNLFLLRLSFFILGLYLVELHFALWTCVPFLGPDLNTFYTVFMFASI